MKQVHMLPPGLGRYTGTKGIFVYGADGKFTGPDNIVYAVHGGGWSGTSSMETDMLIFDNAKGFNGADGLGTWDGAKVTVRTDAGVGQRLVDTLLPTAEPPGGGPATPGGDGGSGGGVGIAAAAVLVIAAVLMKKT